MRVLVVLFVAVQAFGAVTRTIVPGAKGPNRLDVDATLLAHAQPGLPDLRLHDASGREVPYLLIEPSSREPQWASAKTQPIAPTKFTSGFEADLGQPRSIDRIRLAGIAAPFLKRARVEGSGDRARWTLLAEATVFDLPDDELRNLEVPFVANELRYVRLTWDDRASARVNVIPTVSARLHGTGAAPEPLRVAVPFSKRTSEPRKSRYRVTLPGAHLPIEAIEVQVASGDVFREVTISEPRLAGAQVAPVDLGAETIRRAERAGAVASDLDVKISEPEGRDLDITIDDANNPPLAITAIVARFAPQPWIYFESDGTPVTARAGDAKLPAPRYDLEASRKYIAPNVTRASWSGEEKPVAASKAEELPLPPFGATVDRSQFRYSRTIPKTERGLAVLILDADVLSRSSDLADVRIVDAENRQVPYVLERRGDPLEVALKVPAREQRDDKSVYRFAMPYATLPSGTQLVLTTTARVFSRGVEFREAEDRRRGRFPNVFAANTWSSNEPDVAPPALSAGILPTDVIEVVIDEGDNAPLPIASARLLLPSSALRFYHPGSELSLLYGNDQLRTPRYDLELLAPRLFGESARELTLGAATPAASDEGSNERTFFWVAIGVAALVLLALLGKLLVPLGRKEAGPLGETPGGGDAPR